MNTTERDNGMSLEKFTRGYIASALWSSSIGPGHDCPEDTSLESAGYDTDDIAPEALASIEEECTAFYNAHEQTWRERWSDEEAGHDYWLTRNRHGAGFWDRFSGPGVAHIGRRLAEASYADGERDWYVGDDDKIHQA